MVWLNTLPEIGLRRAYGLPGVYVMINDPNDWPKYGKFIPANQSVSFVVEPLIYSTAPEVREVQYLDRLCIYNVSNLMNFEYEF
jgi:hypothetical protein